MSLSVDDRSEQTVNYRQLPAFLLLQQIVPILKPYRYGVGGSLLLAELGLLQQARDLDLVCDAEDFAAIRRALCALNSPRLRPLVVSLHPLYQSEFFSRFVAPDGTEIDLMANIRVRQSAGLIHWQFEPSQLHYRDGIAWMSAEQWLVLYQLFQRPERVTLLQQYLAGDS